MKKTLLFFLLNLTLGFAFSQTNYSTSGGDINGWWRSWNTSNANGYSTTGGIGLYSSSSAGGEGTTYSRFITTDGSAVNSGDTKITTLKPGQKITITLKGQDGGGRTGINNGGRIGFALRNNASQYYDGGTSNPFNRYASGALMEYSYVGGDATDAAQLVTGGTTSIVRGNMPTFATFKSGSTYEIEIISDKEFNFVNSSNSSNPRTNIQLFENSGSLVFPNQITITNISANMDGIFTNVSVSNIPINVTANSGETFTVTGVITDNGGTSNTLQKNGVGTVILSGANTYTGTTTVNSGTLQLNRTGGSTIPSTNNIAIASGGTLKVSTNQTIANLDLSGGGNLTVDANTTLTITGTYTPGTGTITNNGTIVLNNSGLSFPGASTTVSAMNNLQLNANATLTKSITISGALTLTSGKLSIGNNTLTLNGTFSGSASNSLVGSTGSSLSIGGTGTLGTLYFDQTSNTTKTLVNLIINRTSSGAVSLGNSLRLTGELTPTAGVLTTNGNLRLLSSAIGTSAAVGIGSSSGGYISGTVDVERYSQAQRGYRTFAHPYTTAQSVSQLTDNFQVTGLTSGALGTYGVGGSTNPSAFYYDGTKPAGNAYVLGRITKSDTLAWGVGKGLYVFVRGNGSEGTGGAYPSGISPVTLDVTSANINQGDVTVNLTPYAAGADNFTLVGNPYPCPINLSNVTGISSFGTIYLQNPTYSVGSTTSLRGGFEATSSKNIVIPSMGCFYIQSTASTPSSLTFHESDKVTTGSSSYNVFGTGTPTPTLGLEISTSTGFMDRTKLAFDANATSAATDFYDANKLANNLVTFYSLSSDRKALGIDYRKANTTEIIPLGVQTIVANNYTIKLSEINGLSTTQVVLRDKLLNKETILSNIGDSYSFDITADTATKGENRFEIGLFGTTVLPVQLVDVTAQLQTNKTVAVNWTSASEVNLASYKVQRSKDGSNFSTVGTVAAKGASAYSYNDDLSTAGVLPSTIYYRLEAVDKDGSKTYSKVVAVALNSNLAKAAINIYPNPVQATLYAQVTVSKAGAAQLRVIDAQGKVVATQKTQLAIGTTSVSIPATQLTAGNYVLEIESADGKQTQRFVKE